MGDFSRWSELIAGTIAAGSSAEEVRGFLRSTAKVTWQLVSWLTHAQNATHADGTLALDATQSVLKSFASALVRYERGAPERCPSCSSYRLASVYQPDANFKSPYVTACEACGWMDVGPRLPFT